MAKQLKNRETAIEKLSPSMLKYLREVIDTPIEGRGLDAEISRKVCRSRAWSGQMKKMIAKGHCCFWLTSLSQEIIKAI